MTLGLVVQELAVGGARGRAEVKGGVGLISEGMWGGGGVGVSPGGFWARRGYRWR